MAIAATTLLGMALLAQPAAQDAGAKPAAAQELAPWTILIYGAADNNCDGHMLNFLANVRGAIADDPGIQLVVFMDRSLGYSNDALTFGEDFTGGRIYRLGAKTAERLAGGEEFPEVRLDAEFEPDSADPETLRKFLAFGKAHFPARHTGLIIYSHASGITMCPDEQSRRDMGLAQLTDVVTERESVDWMALELCNMGGVEIAYQWRPGNGGFSTDVLVAIPNAGPPLAWKRIFDRMHAVGPAKVSPIELGTFAVEEGEKGRLARIAEGGEDAAHTTHEAAACFDLLAVEDVKSAVDTFAIALAAEGAAAKEAMAQVRGPGERGTVMNYVEDELRGGRAFVDLYDLLRRASECDRLGEASRAAARAAMAATDRFVVASFGMSAYAGFAPGKNGCSIVFPDGDAPARGLPGSRSRVWRAYDWYVPFEHRQPEVVGGNWAWCRDGATPNDHVVENWFELLDSWFDTDDDEGAGLNGYRW
jgi:clostripain